MVVFVEVIIEINSIGVGSEIISTIEYRIYKHKN